MSLLNTNLGQLPTVPTLDGFGYIDFPDAQPFSQRAASGYQESLEGLIYYVQRKLIPFLQQSNPQGIWDSNVAALIAAVNQTIQDTINAISQQQISVTDPAVLAVLNLGSSASRKWLDARFAFKGDLYFNPMDFGAVGDGVHDDTAAVQAAINAAEATWDESEFLSTVYKKTASVVYLPSATFSVNTLIVTKPVRFIGGGADGLGGNCLLQRTVGQSIVLLKCGSVSFEHTRFRSVSGTTSPNVAQIITDASVSTTNSIYIHRCWFSTPETHAIWLKRGGDHQIIGCDFDVSGTGGIKLGDFSANIESGSVKIHNNTFFNIALNCIEISYASDIVISDNLAATGGDGAQPLTSSKFLLISGGPSNRISAHHNIISNIGVAFNVYAGNSVGMLSIDHNPSSVLTTFFRAETDGTIFNASIDHNPISKSNGGAFTEAPFHFAGCGMETGVIAYNTVIAGALSALLVDASDPRITRNIIGPNIAQPFTNNHNLANPPANNTVAS